MTGIAVTPINPAAGGVLFGTGVLFNIWDAIEGAIEVERDINKVLKPIEEEKMRLNEKLNQMEKKGGRCPL